MLGNHTKASIRAKKEEQNFFHIPQLIPLLNRDAGYRHE
jgi:hypothetical protein